MIQPVKKLLSIVGDLNRWSLMHGGGPMDRKVANCARALLAAAEELNIDDAVSHEQTSPVRSLMDDAWICPVCRTAHKEHSAAARCTAAHKKPPVTVPAA